MTRTSSLSIALTTLAVLVTAWLYADGLSRWAFTGDDAYISFRYAKNLVAGDGLVWNPGGEPVEGYTNLGWVLVTAVGLAMGLSAEVTANTVSAGCGIAALLLLVRYGRGDVEPDWTHAPLFAAPMILASTRTWSAWSTSGLETMAYTMLLLAGVLQTQRERDTPWPWVSSLCLGGALLMRPDGLLFIGVLGLAHLWDVYQGRRPLSSLVAWCIPILVVVLGQELFRIAYYGDWMPNTARVKVNGSRWSQGMRYFTVAHRFYGIGWWAWMALIPVLVRRKRTEVVLTACVLLHALYLTYIGGDRFEMRFLIPIAPMVLWLVVESWHILLARAGAWRAPGVLLLALAMSALGRNASFHKPGAIVMEVEQLSFIGSFAKRRATIGKRLRTYIDAGRIPEDIKLCVGAAGALPYFADVHTLDFFGLNDRAIAMQEITETDRTIPGHEKKADAERLIADGIDVFDASGSLFTSRRSDAVSAWKKSMTKLRKIGGTKSMRIECHRFDEHWMVFATTLSAEAHAARFTAPSCTEEIQDVLNATKK